MNRAHRIADQFRSVVGWLGRVPTESQFVARGFLTPAEFVEAGDQLVFQCPTWQWQSCPDKKHQVFWLPANKQYLLTRNIPCRHRVHDWEQSFCKQAHVTSEGWLVPGPQPGRPGTNPPSGSIPGSDSCSLLAGGSGSVANGNSTGGGSLVAAASTGPHRIVECKVRTADGAEFAVRHDAESSSNSEGSYYDDEPVPCEGGGSGPEGDPGSGGRQGQGLGPLGVAGNGPFDAHRTPHHPRRSGAGSGGDDGVKDESTGGDDFVDVAGETAPPIGVQARLANMLTRGANQLNSLTVQSKQHASSRALSGPNSAPRATAAPLTLEDDDFTVILDEDEKGDVVGPIGGAIGRSRGSSGEIVSINQRRLSDDVPDENDEVPSAHALSRGGGSTSVRPGLIGPASGGYDGGHSGGRVVSSELQQPLAGSGRGGSGKQKRHKGQLVPTRSYDLSITYDKYYQSPRLWLFGYDESGVPLRSDAVFEDIHADYLSKTVTVDPHPFTGVPTVSVHPCKHASVMRTVAQNWLKAGMQPRHDLALFVLLKMVGSVVPTINYDFTIDIEMPIGLTLPVAEGPEEEDPEETGGAMDLPLPLGSSGAGER